MAGSQGGGGNTRRGTTRSRDPNPPLVVDANVVAEIGGNLVNLADANQGNPAIIGGSWVVVAAPPIGEGSSQNQDRRKRARRKPVQNPPPPEPQDPIEHPIPDMGEIPLHLQKPPHHLYRLCRKKLSPSDLNGNLTITGKNRAFLIHKVSEAKLAFRLGVDVQLFNGPARVAAPPLSAFLWLNNPTSDDLTLAWSAILPRMDIRFVEKQYIDMWFEMAPNSMNIYIQGR